MNSADNWAVAVHSWIIQDGNYGDFAVGDESRFALEFAASSLRRSVRQRAEAQHLGYGVYRICAQVLFANPKVWVIDFGLRAFREMTPPPVAEPGSWVEGEILLSIDPFFYKEYLHRLPGMPDLFYNWQVVSISRNDTPWLAEVNDRGGTTLSRDAAREAWTEVDHTDAWNDDDGRSDYVLKVLRRDT